MTEQSPGANKPCTISFDTNRASDLDCYGIRFSIVWSVFCIILFCVVSVILNHCTLGQGTRFRHTKTLPERTYSRVMCPQESHPNMPERISKDGTLYALIVRSDYSSTGIDFFTPGEFSQQLGYMNRPKGYQVNPHTHEEVPREVERTQEVLIIRTGMVKAIIFDNQGNELESVLLEEGDVILLAAGGHGFEMLDDTEIIEIKQGPYMGDEDKRPIPGKNSARTLTED